jgi:hypothetical protein
MSMAVPSRSIPLFLSVYKYVKFKVHASPFTNHKAKYYIISQNSIHWLLHFFATTQPATTHGLIKRPKA